MKILRRMIVRLTFFRCSVFVGLLLFYAIVTGILTPEILWGRQKASSYSPGEAIQQMPLERWGSFVFLLIGSCLIWLPKPSTNETTK